MEFMKDLPDNHYDLAIVDPPYGIGMDKEDPSMSIGMRKDGSRRTVKSWSNPVLKGYARKSWDTERPSAEYFQEVQRVSSAQIIWGGNYFADMLAPSGGWVVWDKKRPASFTLSMAELAWVSNTGSVKIFRYLWAGYAQEKGGGSKEFRMHPTQKPVDLYKWLLQNYAKPGQTIFDSHVGSGSIRIACHDLGFDFEGCEIDKDYWEAQEARYKTHAAQGQLFAPAELTKETYRQEEL